MITRLNWSDVWKAYQGLRGSGTAPLSEATYGLLWREALKVGLLICLSMHPIIILSMIKFSQARYIAHAEELFACLIRTKGFACQRAYVTIISQMLKIRDRGLPNKETAYRLWKELEAHSLPAAGRAGVELDAASLRTGRAF